MAQSQGTSGNRPDVRPAAGQARGRHEGRKTTIQFEIEHWKDLPPDAAEMIAQRAYNLLFSRGVEVGVKVSLQVEEA